MYRSERAVTLNRSLEKYIFMLNNMELSDIFADSFLNAKE